MPYIAECGYLTNQQAYDYHQAQADAQERADLEAWNKSIDFEIAQEEAMKSYPLYCSFEITADEAEDLFMNDLEDIYDDSFVKCEIHDLGDGDYYIDATYYADPFEYEPYGATQQIDSEQLLKLLAIAINIKFAPVANN